MLGSTKEITKSPRVVCTVAVYFLVGSITVGGGVVRCSMQVTISLSQPGANEVAAGLPPPASPPETPISTPALPRIRLTPQTLRDQRTRSRAPPPTNPPPPRPPPPTPPPPRPTPATPTAAHGGRASRETAPATIPAATAVVRT